MQHDNTIKKVLITEQQLKTRIAEIGKQISADYAGKNLLLVGTLKGAWVFLADLVREIDMNVEVDFLSVSSYGNSTTTSGEVKVLKSLETDCNGRDVLIVEDIVDSGITLTNLQAMIRAEGAASVEIAALLSKSARRRTDVFVKYIGFDIPDEFVVGFGLDYGQLYRGLKDVCVLQENVYSD